MKLSSVGAVIATRVLVLSKRKKVTVMIGKPKKFRGGNDYYCPFQILGMDDEPVRYSGGVDPVQAIQLALMDIGTRLYSSKAAKAGRLSWNAGSAEGDLGFPVPDVIRDLLPEKIRERYSR
jgi:hypothetical protein